VNVAQALALARARGVDRLDAQLLLGRALGRLRAWLLAHDDAALSPQQAAAYQAQLDRRADGEPLAYLLGEKEFHGLLLQVRPGVLVPRPDTETLVDWAVELLRGPLAVPAAPAVVDLGTGSGAIALALKHAVPAATLTAVDASADARALAADNARRLGLPLAVCAGDWWAGLDDRRFHLAVSNPPYVAQGDPHLGALRHEPATALVAGPQGLDDLRRIVAGAPARLEPEGWLLLEHGHDQGEAVGALLRAAGFAEIGARRDLAGITRCTGGRRPA
jgi:release factor glutamine methyltransferase